MGIPYIGFGNDQLEGQPKVSKGDPYFCPECEQVCYVEYGTDPKTKEECNLLGFIHCAKCNKSWLISVADKYTGNIKPACSGQI